MYVKVTISHSQFYLQSFFLNLLTNSNVIKNLTLERFLGGASWWLDGACRSVLLLHLKILYIVACRVAFLGTIKYFMLIYGNDGRKYLFDSWNSWGSISRNQRLFINKNCWTYCIILPMNWVIKDSFFHSKKDYLLKNSENKNHKKKQNVFYIRSNTLILNLTLFLQFEHFSFFSSV